MDTNITESTEQFLSGGGEMGKLIRTMDWSKTALGPIESWPQSLRTSVSLCLSSTFPILIAWGTETIQIYNDSYRPICGAKHPESMGQNFRICWETALPVVGDAFTRGQQGEGTYITDQRMFLDRYGYLEEAFMTFSFAPIRDESGGVGGIFHPITESTAKMLNARRTQSLRDLGAAIGKAKSIEEIGQHTEEKYQDYLLDLPFLLLYKYDEAKQFATLIGAAGLATGTNLTPHTIDANATEGWPIGDALKTGEQYVVEKLQYKFGKFSCEPYEEAPVTALILPIFISGQETPFGFLIAGVSSRRALDQEYLNFYGLLTSTYNTAISNVYAYEQEQKRAEALAEIDRSKTAFFSNVSHEFRTPLTLMLGPLDDLIKRQELQKPEIKDALESTHRNALRLLKLVNNLLDYSRVEAGRVRAAYHEANLCELTVDLASSFRSIIEKAGMQLEVDCQPTKDKVYVDRQMWEKIVLNLLSNAFKYTLQGSITVSLKQEGHDAVLKVADTGVGIPQKELPHMFERFHRVENSAGRTHEGTGIGLSLVHELVQLHDGQISVESTLGQGSVFTVRIPTGRAHLPADKILAKAAHAESSALKGAFIKEAFSLLDEMYEQPGETSLLHGVDATITKESSVQKDTRILVVDDNSDMRSYLGRLLEPYFTVDTAVNGKDALAKITVSKPDLILCDIMMPVMDGKELLERLKSEPPTARIPLIFLSARAGEEARIDGLEAGADDYLVKPFSAAELLTKVRAQIKIASARSHAERQLLNLIKVAPVAIAVYRGPKYYIEVANERMLQYWGRTAEEVLYKPLFDAIPELEFQGFDEVMKVVLDTGETITLPESPVRLHRFGKEETVYVKLTVEPVLDEHGRVDGMMALAVDLTDQVMARQELEKATDRLQLAMDAAGMGTWRTDWGTNNLEVSETARLIHGIPLDTKLTFNGTLDVVVPEHRKHFAQAILHAVETKGSFNEDYQIQPYDGSKRKWLNSTGKVELNEAGKVTGVIGTILDITESKEDELRKNDFIGMVSHELKTPLTSLSAYTQMLLTKAQKTDDKFNANALDKMNQQVRKMTALINGFLNVSRLESGKIQLETQPFNLPDLINDAIEDIRLTVSSHTIYFPYGVPIIVNADRDKIGAVVSNLLSNAIKYSPRGMTVEVRCEVINGVAQVSVKDEGMGIKPQDISRLFERYYRVNSRHTQNISGFGIGLYLSAEIIERHDGKIWVESELGKGSTFYFSLQLG